MLDDTDTASADTREGEADTTKRASPDRSTIAFPYTHLEDAVTVAKAIFESGTALSRDQLAAVMGLSPTVGSFSLKLGAARTFRLIEAHDGKNKLSELGIRILSSDDSEARSARKEAFLNVPLYNKTFEEFRNRPLPPRPAGLERTFEAFGVAPKQKDKARLAFERSALFAGFFHAGKGRIVEPIIGIGTQINGRPSSPLDPLPAAAMGTPIDTSFPTAARQTLIIGLLEKLPDSNTKWPLSERARWLRALAVNLSMIYGADDTADITIEAPPSPKLVL